MSHKNSLSKTTVKLAKRRHDILGWSKQTEFRTEQQCLHIFGIKTTY